MVFGPSRLPEIGRQVGRGMREFRKFQDGIKGDVQGLFTEDVSDQASPPPMLPPRAPEEPPRPAD
jgi:TatA/E family protein of Tat protein translocase